MAEGGYILLVEDNDDDVTLTVSALKRRVKKRVEVCRDGPEALEFLAAQPLLPGLILLDLKLPKLDGIEVLKRLRAEPRTQSVPVVMLTSSSRRSDMDAAAAAGANSYMVKAVDYQQFTKDIEQLATRWLGEAGA